MKEYIIKVDEDKKDIMGNMPLIDKPQELVRCKDCNVAEKIGEYDFYRCHKCAQNAPWGYGNHGGDWFCADGERKKYKEYDPEWLILVNRLKFIVRKTN